MGIFRRRAQTVVEVGRADAALQAARLLADDRQRVQALALIDRALPKTPESDVAVSLRELREVGLRLLGQAKYLTRVLQKRVARSG